MIFINLLFRDGGIPYHSIWRLGVIVVKKPREIALKNRITKTKFGNIELPKQYRYENNTDGVVSTICLHILPKYSCVLPFSFKY